MTDQDTTLSAGGEDRIHKIGGGYGGPVKVLARFRMSDGQERFVVGFKPEGGYGECAHIFSAAQLSGVDDAALSAPSSAAGATGLSAEELDTLDWVASELSGKGQTAAAATVTKAAHIAAAPKAPTPVTSTIDPNTLPVMGDLDHARRALQPGDKFRLTKNPKVVLVLGGHYAPLRDYDNPVTSAPGADGGEDLAGLSARATPGHWCAHLVLEMTAADSDFCDALVNAYRSGRLTPVAPTPAPVAHGEPVAWAYEYEVSDGDWTAALDFTRPHEATWFRNIRPLYAAPAAPTPAPVALGEPVAREILRQIYGQYIVNRGYMEGDDALNAIRRLCERAGLGGNNA